MAVTILAACGGGGQPAPDTPSTPTSRSSTTSPPTSATTAPTIDGFSECTDAAGDGGPGDLVSVKLATQGAVLGVTFTTTAPVTGTVLWSVTIGSTYQIGLKAVGADVSRFVFDFTTGQQTDLVGAYSIDGATAQVLVPIAALAGITEPFTWKAAVTVAGMDTDDCTATFT